MVDVNTILTLISVRGTSDANQVILDGKVQNQLSESLKVRCFADIGANITYTNSHLLSYILLAWMKGIDSKIIEFGNGSTGKTNKKINLSLQIGTYEEIFRECSIDVPEYDIVLGLDLH